MLIGTRRRAVRDKEKQADNQNNQFTETDTIDFALDSNTCVTTDMKGKEGVADEALIEGKLGDADIESVYMYGTCVDCRPQDQYQ